MWSAREEKAQRGQYKKRRLMINMRNVLKREMAYEIYSVGEHKAENTCS